MTASILELGCGTGAVIGELQRRALAQQYYGVDYSEEAIAYLKAAFPSIQCAVADVMETPNPFDKDSFDVVVLSHTLEHLEEPSPFLQSIHSIPFEYLVAEVPLEDTQTEALFFPTVPCERQMLPGSPLSGGINLVLKSERNSYPSARIL